jgi:UDP-GlcNAc:undecaprenyl-phosphate GlcNAc-1-phosphate transferase
MFSYILPFLIGLVVTLICTPFVKKLALRIGAVDKPNARKVHDRIMPRLGGLAIYLGFVASVWWMVDDYKEIAALAIAATAVLVTGILDDKYDIRPIYKLLGQVIAAIIVVVFGVEMEFIHLPFSDVDTFNFGILSIPITILWIVGVTNSINLMDGLDGLASGVTAIATGTMLVLAVMMGNIPVIILSAALLGSLIAFLFYNFHPAKIFMGDSGSLFLGFMMAVLSLLGFKQAAFASLIVPILILGVPLSDTAFAILRRVANKRPISAPDKQHLHHCLLNMGLSHRGTVLVIYGISLFFGASAIFFSRATVWVEIMLLAVIFLLLTLGAEMIGIIHTTYKPVTNFFKRSKDVILRVVRVKS